jgi:hypothetical protein
VPEHTEPREGSEPEGPDFGKPYLAAVGTTFVYGGSYVCTAIDVTNRRAMVILNVQGKWNHGAEDTLTIFLTADAAKELAPSLTEAAETCPADWRRWLDEHPEQRGMGE